MKVVKGKIANGLTDISKYLNLEPSKSIFLHSLVFDEDDVSRISLYRGSMIYAEILSFMSENIKGPYAVNCHYNVTLLDYMHKEGIINKDKILMVGEYNNVSYPYNSPSVMLYEKLKNDVNLQKRLNGCILIPSFVSKYDVQSAKLINGSLLIDLNENDKYTSKYWFRKIAERDNISVCPGFCFNGTKNLKEAIDKMQEYMPCSVWIKLESQRSGEGNIYLEKLDYVCALKKIMDLVSNIYDEEYIYNELPLIIEKNATTEYEKEVMNIGVEGIITKNSVTILGGVAQKTKDGAYLGSYLDEEVDKYLPYAEEVAKKAFISYSKEGYKGFITIDVIVTKNIKTGKVNAYNIDPNARFSAGLMLLKNIHMSEKITGKKIYGLSFTCGVSKKDDIGNYILECCKDNLYTKEKGFGIIPALLNDVTTMKNDKHYLKVTVLAKSYKEAENMFQEFKDNILKLNK